MKRYRGFGLEIDSELDLPAFVGGDLTKPADVVISLGPIAPPNRSATAVTRWARASASGVWLTLDDGELIHIRNGNEITIQPSSRGSESTQRQVFLMASGFGTLLQQRGFLPLHGGAVATPSGMVGILGVSGAGKSTTTHALVRHGFPLVTDDILAVDASGARPCAHPAYAALKLCGDAIERFDPDHDFEPVRSANDKYRVPTEMFATGESTLRALYVIRRRPNAEVSIRPVKPSGAFRLLDRETFRRELLAAQGFRAAAFASLTEVARSVPVYVLNRPIEGSSHVAVEQAMLDHLN